MKTESIIHTLLTALAALSSSALLLAGCDKQLTPESQDESTGIVFEVAVEGEGLEVSEMDESTKAALKGSFVEGDQFMVNAYDGTTIPVFDRATVTKEGDKWIYSFFFYCWPPGKSLDFYAFYPKSLGTSLSGKTSETGVTAFTYSPLSDGGKDVNGQYDYMLASYKGTGNNGTVPLSFSHMLSSIQFKCGSFDSSFGNITAIEIKGFYNYGTCTPTCGNSAVTYSWGSQNYSSTATLSQTGLSVSPATNATIGEPFVLIPGQNFSTNSLVVKVTGSTGKTASGTLSQNTALAAGKTSVFKIAYVGGDKISFDPVTVTAWGSNAGGSADAEEKVVPTQPDDEIWYTTTDGQIIAPQYYNNAKTDPGYFGTTVISNTYSNGMGIMKFNGPVTKLGRYALESISNIREIFLPSKVASFEAECFKNFHGANPYIVHIPDGFTQFPSVSPFRSCSSGDQIKIVTSTYEYLLVYSGTALHRDSDSGPVSFTVMPQNITFNGSSANCFVKGTLITMADGSNKPVEELEYGDVLKVWNFDEGHEDIADILWITRKGIEMPYYYRCTFSDGTILNVTGSGETGGTHRMFTTTKGMFEHPYKITEDDEIYTDHGLVKLVSYERIDEEIEFFNLITTEHINCFANGVLTSARYNNRYPIDGDMKFVKDGRKIRPYREFRRAGISREWYKGMRLGEQQDSIPRVKAYIDKCEANARPRPEEAVPQSFFTRIWSWIKGLFK